MKTNCMVRCLNALTWMLWLLVVPRQHAQAAPPSVERVEPAAGQRGTQFDLTVVGAGLRNACEVMLYQSGVTCEQLQPVSDNQLVLRLRADNDCTRGTHAFRIRSPEGISELHVFRISTLPIVPEQEPNSDPEDAQSVPLNTTVVGVIEAGDVDCFVVSLKQGERLSAEVEAIRTGSTMFDAVLNVIAPDGSWLMSVDDTPLTRQDPFLSLLAPADGDYLVQLHETNFEGSESSQYALHLGTFPRPTYVFPAGGRADTPVKIRFAGDATGAFEQVVIPEQTQSGMTGVIPLQHGQESPTAMPFRVSPFDNSMEYEPNDLAAEVSQDPVQLPIALNGVLQHPQDIDCFRIQAAAGDTWRLEVFASRLGSPVDSLLEVMDAAGRMIGASDDSDSHDSQLLLTFRESGVYTVQISDKRGNGSEAHFYRIEISPALPRLTAFLARPDRKSQDRQTIAVPQGNRVLTFLACQRTGFSGDVRLTASGLPAGVRLPEVLIPADRFWVPVVVEASDDARPTGTLVEIEAHSATNSAVVSGRFRQIVDLVAGSADQLFQSAEVDRLAVSVVEEVPYRITLQQPASALSPDGTLDLLITAERSGDFQGPIDVSFPFLPPWVDGPEKITIHRGASSAIYTLHAWPLAEQRKWNICAEALAGIDTEAVSGTDDREAERSRPRRRRIARVPVASNMVPLEINDSPVSGSIVEVVLEQGNVGRLVCDLQVTGNLPAAMTAVLEGLPNRVVAREVSMSPEGKQIVFEVSADTTAPVGVFDELVVRLNGQVSGQNVSWSVGRGSVLRIEAVGTLVTDDTGRPLSRLEVLRRGQQNSPR